VSINRDSMVITPRINPRESGPRRRAKEARKTERAQGEHKSLLRYLREARKMQTLRAARASSAGRQAVSAGSRVATKMGVKAGSRAAGQIGIALLFMDAIDVIGSTVRRAEQGVSGRLLEAMDQDGIYGNLDEIATGAARGRASIEGNEDLLKIIGRQGRVNAQIGRIGAYFRERETARAIGSDLIEREPGFDHLESISDKVIAGYKSTVKGAADRGINALRSFYGKGAIQR